jgi:hypothetical protein
MEHSTVRQLIRATTLSLLVLATTSGVAGSEVLASSPARSQPDGAASGSAPASDPGQPDPTSPPVPGPVPPLPGPGFYG